MRSLSLALLLIPLLLSATGCKRRHNSSGQTQLLASSIYAGDPNVAAHFAKGFYATEEGAWRWTGKEFAVDLSPPLHSDRRGAQLVMKLSVPDAVIQKLTSVQLSASIQGYKLEPQTYTKPGQYTLHARRARRQIAERCGANRLCAGSRIAAYRDRPTAIGDHRERSWARRQIRASK